MARGQRITRIKGWVRLLILITIFSLISCGIILTLALTRTNRGNLLVAEQRFYMVASSRNTSLALANRDAAALRAMGGAGFVAHTEEAFYTIAAVYRTSTEAQAVADRLSQQEGFNATVFIRISPRITRVVDCFLEAEVLAELLTRPLELIDALTTLSIDLSANRVSDSHAMWLLNSKRGGLVSLSNNITNLNEEFIYAQSTLNEFYANMLVAFTNAASLSFSNNLSVNILHLVPLIIETFYNTVLNLQLIV